MMGSCSIFIMGPTLPEGDYRHLRGNEAPSDDHLPARRGSSVFLEHLQQNFQSMGREIFRHPALELSLKWFSADRFYL